MTTTATKSTRRTTKLDQRTVTVVSRAVVKRESTAYNVRPGDIISLVRNGEGKVYTVTLRRESKCHSCTCAGNVLGHRRCYHIDALCERENARWQAESDKAASLAAYEAERAEADHVAAEAKAIEAARIAAKASLVEAGEVATTAKVAERAKKTRRAGMATKRADDEAAVSTIVVELAKVREAKQLAASSEKSSEQAMMDAPLTTNQGFSLMKR